MSFSPDPPFSPIRFSTFAIPWHNETVRFGVNILISWNPAVSVLVSPLQIAPGLFLNACQMLIINQRPVFVARRRRLEPFSYLR